MSWTYDPETVSGMIRLLIPDTNPDAQIFSDAEIDAFRRINSLTWQSSQFFSASGGQATLPATPSNILRAAALALNTLAGNSARLAAVTQLLDVKLDSSKAAQELRDTAQRYLDMDEESGAFAIAEQVNTVWAWQDRWIAQIQRQQGGMPVA